MKMGKRAWSALLVVALLVSIVLFSRDSHRTREAYVCHWLGSGPTGAGSHEGRRAYGLCGGASPRGRQATWNFGFSGYITQRVPNAHYKASR